MKQAGTLYDIEKWAKYKIKPESVFINWYFKTEALTEGTGNVISCVFSCVRLFVTPWTVACQAPLSVGFSRQEYWSRLLFPLPGDLPDQGIESTSPALAGGFFTLPLSQRGSYGVTKSRTPLGDWTWAWKHHKGLCCYFIMISFLMLLFEYRNYVQTFDDPK